MFVLDRAHPLTVRWQCSVSAVIAIASTTRVLSAAKITVAAPPRRKKISPVKNAGMAPNSTARNENGTYRKHTTMLKAVPITFKQACEFVAKLHRHNKPPVGHKFSIGAEKDLVLVGVVMCGRPVARLLDNGLTLEVNRTCTDGSANVNSFLYGAARKAAWAMGYVRVITYTQADESGASLRAAGFLKVKELPARDGWAKSSGERWRDKRDPVGSGGVPRALWEVRNGPGL